MDKDALTQALTDKIPFREIARRNDISYTTVRYWVKTHDLQHLVEPSGNRKFRIRPDKVYKDCKHCGEATNFRSSIYCSIACSAASRRDAKCKDIESSGILHGPNQSSYVTQKRYLIDMRGHKCEICELDSWRDQPMPLVFDHIDGDSSNGRLDNCRLVCGNCDMQLPTYKGRNIGKGRASRRQRYADGKSY